MKSSLPSKIGRYEVVDKLGEGGMGVVYLATDPLLRRTVAIKVLPGQDEELRERFAREARSAASLRHHNVVTIYDIGEDDGKAFLAMEFLDGESMAELIRRRAPLSIERRLQLMIELCAGLGFAHRGGIIHRDIKPGNLMITNEGTLKVLDFGLARVMTEGTNTGLTRVGSVMGTPHYMSPEQVEGKIVDPRSDIFAVGVVLYELLSFRKAYTGDSAHVVLHNIMHATPTPIRDLVPEVDAELARIVEKGLEKNPSLRYQDLAAFGAELERVRARLAESADGATLIERRPTQDERTVQVPMAESSPARGARSRANLDVLARRRAAQVESHVNAAAKHLAAERYDEALAECENAMLLSPEDGRAVGLMAQAQAALDDRQVRDLLDKARARLAVGDLTEAQALIEQTLVLRADSAEAQNLRVKVREQRAERERAAERARAAKAAVDRAARSFQEGAFEAAARSASEALAYDSSSPEALELRRKATEAIAARRRQEQHDQRAAEVVEQARLSAAADNPQAARALLEAFDPPHPLVTEALGLVRAQIAAVEQRRREEEERQRQQEIANEARRQRIAALKAKVTETLQAGRIAEAEAAVSGARPEFSGQPDFEGIASKVRHAKEEADAAAQDATAAIARANGLMATGDSRIAIGLLEAFSPQALVAGALAELKQQHALLEKQRELEKQLLAEKQARLREAEARKRVQHEKSHSDSTAAPSSAQETVFMPSKPRPVAAPVPVAKPAAVPAPVPVAARVPVPTPAPTPTAVPVAASVPLPTPATSVPLPVVAPLAVPTPRPFPVLGVGAVAAVLLVAGGGWFLGRDRGQPEPNIIRKDPATGPVIVEPPAVDPAAEEVKSVHAAFSDAMRQANLGQAANAIGGASPGARQHSTLTTDVEALLTAARKSVSDTSASAKTAKARASQEFRSAQTKQNGADELARRGQPLEASREFIAAADLFARASASGATTTTGGKTAGGTATPVNPTPVNPSPNNPTPVNPTPVNPVPVSPTPVNPVPVNPTPVNPTPVNPTPVNTAAADDTAIRGVLTQYVDAYQRRDVGAIRRVWLNAPASLNLSEISSYSLILENMKIALGGDTATVTATRRVKVQLNVGKPQEQKGTAVFTMRRTAGGWAVESVR